MDAVASFPFFLTALAFPLPQVRFRLEQLATFFDLPRGLNNFRTMLSQKYDGDITIVPQMTVDDYMKYVWGIELRLVLKLTSISLPLPPPLPGPLLFSASCPIPHPNVFDGRSEWASWPRGRKSR